MTPVNRDYPVTLLVSDPTHATVEFAAGASIPLEAKDNKDLMLQARELIGEHADSMGGAALPVTIMDNSDPEPFLDFRLCTAEGKMPKDQEVPAAAEHKAKQRYAQWLAALIKAKVRPAETVTVHQAPEPLVQTPVEVERPPSVEVLEVERPPVPETIEVERSPSEVEDPEPMEVDRSPSLDRFDMPTLMKYGADDEVAERGWRGSLNTLGLHLAPNDDEKAWRAAVKTMNRPWPGMMKVAVVNERGGAGKTIVSANLAAAFAHATALPVAGFDNNETGGNWHKRTGLNHGHKLTSLDTAVFYRERGGIMTRDELDAHSHRHPRDHYSLFAAHRSFKRYNPETDRVETVKVTPRDVSDFYRAVNGHFRLTVTDSGNALGAPNWEQMVEECDQLVVPVMTDPARDDGALEAFKLLDEYGGHFAELAANAVVVVSVWRRGDKAEAQEAIKRWKPRVRKVVVVPHDSRLSGGLSLTKLRPKTQLAWMQVGAAVAEGFPEVQG